jgi:hypothetical protein
MIALSVAALMVFGAWRAEADPDHAGKRANPAVARKSTVAYVAPAAGLSPEFCKRYPALDEFARKRNLDPKLVRAVAITESNLDPCAAALAGKGSGCYDKGYDFVPDPDARCTGAAAVEGLRYCGLGLMQTLEPPHTFWPADLAPDGRYGPYSSGAPKNQLFSEAQGRGRLSFLLDAKACSSRFNPFNPDHSACLGTSKLADAMGKARKLVDKSMGELGYPDPGTTGTITAYLALHDYHGDGADAQAWVDEFGRRRAQTEELCGRKARKTDPVCVERSSSARPDCYGMGDFVAFVRECRFHHPDGTAGGMTNSPEKDVPPFYGDYGSRVLSIAEGVGNACRGR